MSRLLLGFVVLNAVLYSLLLPLWEGFDEPFHYGYVQHLAAGKGLPDARTATLSAEIAASLRLAPASASVQQNLPQVTSYGEYFHWDAAHKLEQRRRLRAIPAGLRAQPSSLPNYEAHQPPLAYFLLAIPERLLTGEPLLWRVAILRIAAALAGSLLLLAAAARLFTHLGLPPACRTAALFCLFCSQMTWATLAHIGNDWLALPIAAWALVALLRYDAEPHFRTAAVAAAILAAGLLVKAYFLLFVPLAIALCFARPRWRHLPVTLAILLVAAGPWYARNQLRYGTVTGTQEARAGIDAVTVCKAAPSLDWPAVLNSSVRAALWTGNNTFRTFSASTLTALIAVFALALLLGAATHHHRAEWLVLAYSLLFALGLAYAGASSHVYSHGIVSTPSPWYGQVLSAPLLGFAFLGVARWGRAGRVVGAALTAIFAFVLVATYAAKLIPLYGGYTGRTSLSGIAALYTHHLPDVAANLDALSLAPAAVVLPLAAVTIALAPAILAAVLNSWQTR